MRTAVSTTLQASIACWYAFELGLAVRDLVRRKGRLHRDRGTRAIVSLTLFGSFVIGAFVTGWVTALATPAPRTFDVIGIVVFWIGLGVRAWAVVTLGGSFRTSVEVDTDQVVVTSGPYRWVRHPAYTGLLLIALGFGIGVGNWLSLAICMVVPALGLLPRIAVEEAEMIRVLGEPYRSYQAKTYRLIPGLW